MKDTLRKIPSKSAGSNSEFDVISQSSDSASQNPWATETSPTTNGAPVSRQVTKTSDKTDASPPPPRISVENSSSSRLEVPAATGDGQGTTDAKPTRRRKTITKTPHTFELEADLIPAKAKETPTPAPMEAPKPETPVLKKKKRVSQPPVPDIAVLAPNAAQTAPAAPAPPSTPKQASTTAPPAPSPSSPRPPSTTATVTPVNPFTTHRPKKSLSMSSAAIATSNPCRFTPPPLPAEAFHGKVIVMTNGASQIGQSLIRQFHNAGSRVIFGDSNSDQARKLISSLPPPHVVHFNKCDMRSYSDILALFKLATTMYGRVDHAIFGVGDDGGQTGTVGEGESGWFEDRTGVNKTSRMAFDEVETEPVGLADVVTASVRFARIAIAYLKYSPKSKPKKSNIVNPYASAQPEATKPATSKDDRSLTFVTSVAAFKETPLLPVYQVSQHAILGLLRSLRTSVDPDPERDGVRVNAVATNIMVPRATAQSGGRMSVQLPPDRPEDIARVIVGVVATNSSAPVIGSEADGTGITNGGGIWYEKGHERGMSERYLHGRVIHCVGADCWDVQEGLDRSEAVWMGGRPSEALAREMNGLSVVGGSNWILDSV